MQVRLKLKAKYSEGSKFKNDSGFIRTNLSLPIGKEITFARLIDNRSEILAGDLEESHYKYFENRTYKSVKPPYRDIKVELQEI